MKETICVVVTGAAGQIAYSLLYQVASGQVFGPDQPVHLNLLDIPPMMDVLGGVVMEITDCAFPLVVGVTPTSDLAVAFKDVDAAFMVGSMPRKQGMERKELLNVNGKIFKDQGQALDKYAKKTVKVLVVGNPANTNAYVCSHFAPSIPKENFSAMTRLDQNRATAQIALKLKLPVKNVHNVVIWGNHSSTQFPDAFHGSVMSQSGGAKPIREALNDDNWLKTDFVSTVQMRGAAVIAARKMSSAVSAAKAASDHMHDLWNGTAAGRFVSMAVRSDGSYNVPKDLMFSFPVTCSGGKWSIVQGLKIDDFSKNMLEITAKELMEEKEDAMALYKD